MPDYVVNIDDNANPTDDKWALRGAAEIRAIKSRLNTIAIMQEGLYPLTRYDEVIAVKEFWKYIARFGGTIESADFEVKTAAAANTLEFDVRIAGVSIFTTKPTIDATETWTGTAAIPAVINAAAKTFVRGNAISFHCTNAANGLAVYAACHLKYKRTSV